MNFDFKRMLKYERNLSIKEKQYRLYAGITLIVISVFTASILLLILGMFCIAEWYFSWCPICSGLNRNTYEGEAVCCAHNDKTAETPAEESNSDSQ